MIGYNFLQTILAIDDEIINVVLLKHNILVINQLLECVFILADLIVPDAVLQLRGTMLSQYTNNRLIIFGETLILITFLLLITQVQTLIMFVYTLNNPDDLFLLTLLFNQSCTYQTISPGIVLLVTLTIEPRILVSIVNPNHILIQSNSRMDSFVFFDSLEGYLICFTLI